MEMSVHVARKTGSMTEIDYRALDDMIESEFDRNPENLIMILQALQRRYKYLPEPVLKYISAKLNVSMSRIYGIATFYAMFSLEPQGRQTVQVCMGTACHVRGASELLNRSQSVLNLEPGQTDPQMEYTLKTVNCLGCCALGPVMTVGETYHSNPSTAELEKLLKEREYD